MQIKFFLAVLFPVLVFVFQSCSDFDQYTTVGSDVVKDANPDLVDFDGNFLPFLMDSSIVSEAGSIPADAPGSFGRHENVFAVGNEDGISISAVSKFIIDTALANRLATAEIDSVLFVLDTIRVIDTLADSIINASPFTITYNEAAELSAYLYSGDTDDAPSSDGTMLCAITADGTDDSTYKFIGTCLENDLFASINDIAEEYRTCIDDTTVSVCETRVDRSVFVSFFSEDDDIYWFARFPKMLVMSHAPDTANEDETVTFIDTIFSSSRIDVNESEDLCEENNQKALSEKLTERSAVFTLDMTSFWDSVRTTGFPEILSAALIFDPDAVEFTSDEGFDSIVVRYMLSDTYYTNGLTFNNIMDTMQSMYSATKSIPVNDIDTISFPVDYHLQNFRSDKPSQCYFYLQIKPAALIRSQEILWSKPQFKAFLTTLK